MLIVLENVGNVVTIGYGYRNKYNTREMNTISIHYNDGLFDEGPVDFKRNSVCFL